MAELPADARVPGACSVASGQDHFLPWPALSEAISRESAFTCPDKFSICLVSAARLSPLAPGVRRTIAPTGTLLILMPTSFHADNTACCWALPGPKSLSACAKVV